MTAVNLAPLGHGGLGKVWLAAAPETMCWGLIECGPGVRVPGPLSMRCPHLARNVSAGPHGDFRSWGLTGCAISPAATAALDPRRTTD